MVINTTINKTLSFHDSVKMIHVTRFLTKRNINTFDVLTFIQMRTDENKFWHIRNTSGNGCVQVRRDFHKWLCKKNLADCHEQCDKYLFWFLSSQ